ncbi:MAG: dephospho-CoA kinase [Polaromonas sp.]|jgi:dephospho-CoA kinase|nr:dephospho-CoA kinase [Polaromonas sp.]MBL0251883.1 dephospho-CoA kinase [Polaromonas sp.]MBP6088754.1 dephospho-CoA kinase [Polaromonas sp.]MBP6157006.1 dephospho-CoA kinase [Polaromonas sp.]MBP7114858.1 dephospho-CoA kinase [Polaromonas sp.]
MQFGAYRVGITGGIGSGKSTVTTQLKSLGAGVIDADAISRHLTSSHGEAMNAIVEKFGDEYQLADGSLDRSRMRELVFNQKDRRKELEQILHPLIQNEMKNQFETMKKNGIKLVVFDLPLLAESSKWRKNLDKIIVVDCSVETQVSRVLTRDVQNNNRTTPMTRDLVINIIASQASRIDRLKLADVIILNDEITRQQLNDEIGQISEYLSPI